MFTHDLGMIKYIFVQKPSSSSFQLPIIETITLEEVCAYLRKLVTNSSNPDFRKLSVQIVGSSEPSNEPLPTYESTLSMYFFIYTKHLNFDASLILYILLSKFVT